MKEHHIQNDEKKERYVGINYTKDGKIIDKISSTHSRDFSNNDIVVIENMFDDIRSCTIGNIKEAYSYLREEITSKEPHNLFEYCECVQQVILSYFGNSYYQKRRPSFFPTEKEIAKYHKKRGEVADLIHKNAALCFERAMLSQNLLSELGFISVFKVSKVIINDKEEDYAYNLVSHNDKYYIFDATLPSIVNNQANPIICEISKEVYDQMIKPINDNSLNVHTNHLNPLQNLEYDIIYDASKEKKNNSTKTLAKKQEIYESI